MYFRLFGPGGVVVSYTGCLNLKCFASWWQLWASWGDGVISSADLFLQAWTYLRASVFTHRELKKKSEEPQGCSWRLKCCSTPVHCVCSTPENLSQIVLNPQVSFQHFSATEWAVYDNSSDLLLWDCGSKKVVFLLPSSLESYFWKLGESQKTWQNWSLIYWCWRVWNLF